MSKLRVEKLRAESSRKISAESVALAVRSRFNPIANLTAERLVQRMETWDAGWFYDLGHTLATIIRRDDKVRGCVVKRLNSLARYGWEVTQTDDVPEGETGLAEKQVEALTFFFRNLTARSVLRQRQTGGMRLLCQQLGSALAYDHSVHEIVWQPRGEFYTAELWHCPVWFFEGTTGDLRFSQTPGSPGVEMQELDWLVAACDGIGQATAIAWMFKRLPLRDWLAASKKFGIPYLHGTTDAQSGSKEWSEFVKALGALANDGAVVTSNGTAVTTVEPKNVANLPMKDLVEWADRALVSLWRGSDLGSMSQKGDSVGSQNQQSETDTLEHDDTLWLSETLQTQLARKVLALSFGDAPVYAEIRIKTLQKQNVETELKVWDAAVKAGVRVSKASFAENFRVPIADDADEDVLEAAAPSADSPSPSADSQEPIADSKAQARKGAKNVKAAADSQLSTLNSQLLSDKRVGEWLAPAAKWFDQFEALAANTALSDAQMLAEAQRLLEALPELAMNTDALMELMREGMGTAAIAGAKKGAKK